MSNLNVTPSDHDLPSNPLVSQLVIGGRVSVGGRGGTIVDLSTHRVDVLFDDGRLEELDVADVWS